MSELNYYLGVVEYRMAEDILHGGCALGDSTPEALVVDKSYNSLLSLMHDMLDLTGCISREQVVYNAGGNAGHIYILVAKLASGEPLVPSDVLEWKRGRERIFYHEYRTVVRPYQGKPLRTIQGYVNNEARANVGVETSRRKMKFND